MDCRQQLRRAAREGVLVVQVTKHALQRAVERQPRLAQRKIEEVLDVFRNIVKHGRYRANSTKVLIWTKNYTLLCTFNLQGKLVVKTVITKASIQERMKKLLSRGATINWRQVIVEPARKT